MFARYAFATSLVLAVSLGSIGCALEGGDPSASMDDEGTTSAEGAELSTFGKALVGAYTRVDGFGAPTHIALAGDGTYATENVVMCVRAPCNPILDAGRWTAKGSGSRGTLKLASTQGNGTKSWSVKLKNAGATLQLSGAGLVQHMSRDVPASCGGIAALQCPAGSECVYPDVVYPDVAGTCVKRGGLGTTCGGIGGLPCDAGLVCKLNVVAGQTDAMGTCSKP